MFFIETQLVFGCKSSPEVARMLIMINQLDMGMDLRLSVQQIDDNSVAVKKGSLVFRLYYQRYLEISLVNKRMPSH